MINPPDSSVSPTWEIREGDALERLRDMPEESVHCCITSPPYYGLRDYDIDGQLGLEDTLAEYVERLVVVFEEVRRVLRKDGTLWLNLGDSYAGSWGAQGHTGQMVDRGITAARSPSTFPQGKRTGSIPDGAGYKPKDLLGMPWTVAFALREAGWYLRSDIIWAKPNPMPESITDRPTSAHEHVFLLAKSARYFYDATAIREGDSGHPSGNGFAGRQEHRLSGGLAVGGTVEQWQAGAGRNKRNVWEIATQPYPEAHFATFPPKLVEPCILAGTAPEVCVECGGPRARVTERYDTGRRQKMADGWDTGEGGHGTIHRNAVMATRTIGWQVTCDHDAPYAAAVVLDPFSGAGTTALVALRHGRSFIGLELNPEYCELARERIRQDAPLLNTPAEWAA